jgi:hypothetical protein
VAKQIKLKGYRRLTRTDLIENLAVFPEIEKQLNISWWKRYHIHVYGVGGLLLGILGIAIVFIYNRPPANWRDLLEEELRAPIITLQAETVDGAKFYFG